MPDGNNITTLPSVVLSAQSTRNGKQSADLAQAIASALAATLLACGGPLLITGVVTMPVFIAMIAATVASAAALGTLSVIGPVKRYVPFAAAAAAALAAGLMLVVPDARVGLFSMVNGLVYRFDDAFGAYVGLVQGCGNVAGSVLFGICAGIVFGAASWALTRLRTTGVTLVAVVLACGAFMRLNAALATPGCAVGVAGWLTQCRYAQLRGSMCSMGSLGTDVGINIATCAAAFLLAAFAYTPLAAVDNAHEAMQDAIDQVRYGEETLPGGNLAKAANLNADSDAELVLTPSGTFSDDVLLAGFTGGKFTQAGWEPLDHTAYEGQWSGIMPWLSGQGLSPAMQRAAYEDAADREAPRSSTIAVDASKAYRKHVFASYTLSGLSGARVDGNLDGAPMQGFFGSRSYTLTVDDIAPADVLDDASWLESSQASYAQAESVYSAFSKEHYLDVDDAEAADIKRLFFDDATWDQSAASSQYAVISRVRIMMDTLASYTDSPQAVPADRAGSFTSWLLEQSREGNSAYFATVATLAFRTQGIPARYVEGYRASSGELAGAALTGSNVTLGSRDAHAWTEVYLDGLGWTPIEVTPGFYTQAVQPDSIINVSEAWSSGAGDQVLQTGSVAGQTDDEDEQHDGASQESILVGIARSTAAALIAAVVAVAALFAQRVLRIRKRAQLCASDDQAVAVPALYRYLAAVMAASKAPFDATKPLENVEGMRKTFPNIDPLEFKRVIELHQAFAFGGHTLKPNEMRTLRRFDERLHGELPACKGKLDQLDRFFVKAL